MTITAIPNAATLTPLPSLLAVGQPEGRHHSTADLRNDVLQALRANPEALRSDPALRDAVRQLRQLESRLGQARGPSSRAKNARARLRRQHWNLLQRLQQRLRRLSIGGSPSSERADALGQAATERYGDDLGGQLKSLLSSNLPFDKLVVMFGALMNDHYEKKVKDVMGKMATQAEDGKGTSSKKGTTRKVLGGVLKIFSGLAGFAATVAGGPAAGALVGTGLGAASQAVSGGSSSGTSEADKQASNNQLQAELQYAMQKMTQWNDLVSNLSKKTNDMAMTIISNLR